LAALLVLADELAGAYAGTPRGDFWAAVAAALDP
jgi:hypothetical protein